jgi:hypothetical protein
VRRQENRDARFLCGLVRQLHGALYLTDPAVQSRFRCWSLQADVIGHADHQALFAASVRSPPGTFFNPSGREIQGLRVIGFSPPINYHGARSALGCGDARRALLVAAVGGLAAAAGYLPTLGGFGGAPTGNR